MHHNWMITLKYTREERQPEEAAFSVYMLFLSLPTLYGAIRSAYLSHLEQAGYGFLFPVFLFQRLMRLLVGKLGQISRKCNMHDAPTVSS